MKKKDNSIDGSENLSVAASELSQSAKGVDDLSASNSGSDDEMDAKEFNRQTSQRFASQSSRRMSLAQSNRFSIKSHANLIENIKKNQELLEAAQLVNFEGVAVKEKLSFIELARRVRKNTNEAVLDAALKKERMNLRWWDSLGGILTLGLILIYIIEYENFATETDTAAFNSGPLNDTLRVIMLCIAGGICVVQYFHYTYLLKIDKVLKLKDKKDTLWSSGYFKFLVLEIILSGIVCPPQLDSGFNVPQLKGEARLTYDGLCCLLALTRFYNVLKIPEQYSIWTTEKSTKICKIYKFKPDTGFMIKAELKRSPYVAIFASLFIVAILFGLAMHTIELMYIPGPSDTSAPKMFESWVGNFFFIFVTMVTVGYGDIYPKTHIGRFVVLWVAVIGTMVVSLMVVALTNSTALTTGEIRVFNKVDQLSLKNDVKKIASDLIYNVFLMYRSNKEISKLMAENAPQKQVDDLVLQRFAMLSKCRPIVNEFKTIHHKLMSTTSIPEDLILTLLENNDSKFKNIFAKFGKVKFIQEYCEKIVQNQEEIMNRMENVTMFNNKIATTLVNLNLKYMSNV